MFPQFGQPDTAMPQHGFARSSLWSIKEVNDTPDECTAIFLLSDSAATREKWPNAFALEYVVALSASDLKMTLRIKNSGYAPFKFMALLHTYFKIPQVGNAAVRGLQGLEYIDKVAGARFAIMETWCVWETSFLYGSGVKPMNARNFMPLVNRLMLLITDQWAFDLQWP